MTPRAFPIAVSIAFGLALGLGGLAANAAASQDKGATQSSGRQCFLPRQVSGFQPVDDDTVNVEIGPRIVYQLELFGICQDVKWNHRIGIRSTHGASWVCQGNEAELLVSGPTGVDRCQVSSVRRLSDEEVAAYRKDRKRR